MNTVRWWWLVVVCVDFHFSSCFAARLVGLDAVVTASGSERTSAESEYWSTPEPWGTPSVLSRFDLRRGDSDLKDSCNDEDVGIVQNFIVQIHGTTASLTWEPPANGCVTEYVIYLDYKEYTRTTELAADLVLTACQSYTISITVSYNNVESEQIGKIADIPGRPANPPKFITSLPYAVSAKLTLELDADACGINSLTITCEAKPENNDLTHEWVKTKTTKVQEVKDSERKQRITTTVKQLSEYTNYTCTAFVTNSVDHSEASPGIPVRTLEGKPSQPRGLQVFDITSRRFKLSWNEPYKIPGVMLKYRIHITNQGPGHEVQDECKNTTSFVRETEVDVHEFVFEEAYPNYKYAIQVFGVNSAGNGTKAAARVTTETARPEAPGSVTSKVNVINNMQSQYEVVQTITWNAPCNPNGPLKGFSLVFDERYVDDEETFTRFTDTINKNTDDSSFYTYNVTLDPSYEYNVSISALLEDGKAGEEARISFRSPDGYPGPPILDDLGNVTGDSFEVSWKAPQLKVGKILRYIITVEPEGNGGSDGRRVNTNEVRTVEQVGADVFTYKHEARSSSKYRVYVQAETAAGIGPRSEIRTGMTPEDDIQTVENFNVAPESFKAVLTWEPPVNGNVDEYYIFLDDIERYNTTELTYELDELNACQKYNIGIAVSFKGNRGQKTTKAVDTLEPEKITDAVESLTATGTKEGIHVAWQPPEKIYKCLTGYKLNWWDVDTNKVTGSDITESPEYDIKPLIGCMKYSVMVTPVIGTSKEGPSNTTEVDATKQVTDPPKLITSKPPQKTSVTLTYELEAWNENMCEITNLTVTCEAKPENNDLEHNTWVIREAIQIEQIVDSQQRRRITTTVDQMSEFTNYTCTAIVTNSAGDSAPSSELLIQTLKEVPSQPQSLEAFDATSGGFKLKWTEPAKVPGAMLKYRVHITSKGPKHEVQDECKNSTDASYEIDGNVYQFEFEEAYPDYEYNIGVCAVDDAGAGDEATTSVLTETAEPDAPEHLENGDSYVMNTPEEYTAIQTITWDAPCDSNGPLKGFVMEIDERYVEDTDGVTNQVEISKNSDDSFFYSYNLTMKPACEYKVKIKAVLEDGTVGTEALVTFDSPVGYPGKPILGAIEDITRNSFAFGWEKPQMRAGEITGYTITIEPEPVHEVPNGCDKDDNKSKSVGPDVSNFKYDQAWPNYKYTVHLAAVTSAGTGLESDVQSGTTPEAEPEQVRNAKSKELYGQTDTYTGVSTITFDPPCNLNGPGKGYQVRYTWSKRHQTNDSGPITISGFTYDISLLPDYDYTIEVIVLTQNFQSTTEVSTFHSKPGVPKPSTMLPVPKSNGTSTAYFRLSSDAFDQTNGDVLYYALILMAAKQTEHLSYGFWDGENWPDLPQNAGKGIAPYQATMKFWQPFELGEREIISFVFGIEKDCSDKHFCNKALKEDTKYCLVVRALTRKTYRDSQCLEFRTEALEDDLNLGLILGLIFGLLAAAALIVFIVILWRRKRHILIKQESVRRSSASHGPVGVKKFSAHYDYLQENYSLLKVQFTVLGTSSKELELSTTYAVLPENRRKNRYTNILPFDDTRVKLQIDEDDEICSDYINASYVKGYSGKVEYIATQGPLESTAKDFWKMVLQENVTMIVMVSQFVEQNKEKCFKYFPNNHENMSFADNLAVTCSTELHFGTYCVRTLQVEKDKIQHTVTHMQFLEWPDFGVPVGTDNMLQFCQQMRERIKSEGGLIAVHCSAGVGRTGTLIATDILLQTIEDHRDIDIFKSVLELRKQRINMVQTEKQYMFIHTCIRDALEMPTVSHDKTNEVMYENLNILKSSAPFEDHHALTESESAL